MGLLFVADAAKGQVIGTQTDLLDDTISFSSTNLSVRRYATLPTGSLGNQQTKAIISLTTQPGDSGNVYSSSQDGRIFRIAPDGDGGGVPNEWFNVNSSIAVQDTNTFHGGLRGIAFHPDFSDSAKNGYGKFYGSLLADSNAGGGGYIGSSSGGIDSVVAEWTYDFGSEAVSTGTYRELFRVKNPQFDHPVKQIKFNPLATPADEDYGLLYIAHGDGSVLGQQSGTGQVLSNALGAILRVDPIDPDGLGPLRYSTPGNTFSNDGDAGTLAEIYSAGHRNPHHLDFGRSADGNPYLITAEVGQDLIDEVNIIEINTDQPGSPNGFNYGWGEREGTFFKFPDQQGGRGYGIRPPGGGIGDSGDLLPIDDGGNEFIYPALQLDHNDPADGNRFGVSGGPIIDGRYYYSVFAGNGVRPGGQIFSAGMQDLLAQKTTFDAGAGEDTSDLSWIDDHLQHRLEYDHDNNSATTPLLFDDFAQLLGFDEGSNLTRSDVRFGQTPDGDLLLSSKQNGAIYLVTNNVAPLGPSVTLTVDLASGAATFTNQRDPVREIDGYNIFSASGSLDPAEWVTLESQGIDPDWVASPPSASLLAELKQFGASELDASTQIALGKIYKGGALDLEFSYLLANGSDPTAGTVTYVLAGDYNDDGVVDAADYTIWRDSLQSGAELLNDLTPGIVDASDLEVWSQNYGATMTAMIQAIPEPGSCGLALLAATLLGCRPRRSSDRRSEPSVSRGLSGRILGVAALALVLLVSANKAQAQPIQIAFGDRSNGLYTNGTDGVVNAGPAWNATGAGVGSTSTVADFGAIVDAFGLSTGVTVQMGLDDEGSGFVDYGANPRQSSAGGSGVFANDLWRNWIFSQNNENLFVRVTGLAEDTYDIYALVREPNQFGRSYSAYIGVDGGGSSTDDTLGDLDFIGFASGADDSSSLDDLEDYFTTTLTIEPGDSLVVAVDPINFVNATLQGLQIVPRNTLPFGGACENYDACFTLVSEHLFQAIDNGPFDGDLNGSGVVDYADFRLAKNFPWPSGTSLVPEPASALLLSISLLATSRLRGCPITGV